MLVLHVVLVALWAAVHAACHFTVTYPETIAQYSDVTEGTAPCGGANITVRNNTVGWPVAGFPVGLLTTHPQATYEIRAALANATDDWKDMVPKLNQTGGVGYFCLQSVPGVAAWVGQDAVVQITQRAVDGALYQVSSPTSRQAGSRH